MFSQYDFKQYGADKIADLSEMARVASTMTQFNTSKLDKAGIRITYGGKHNRYFNNKGVLSIIDKETAVELGYVGDDNKIHEAENWFVNKKTLLITPKYKKRTYLSGPDMSDKLVDLKKRFDERLTKLNPRISFLKQCSALTTVNIQQATSPEAVLVWFNKHSTRRLDRVTNLGGFDVHNHSMNLLFYHLQVPETKATVYFDLSVTAINDTKAYVWLVNADKIYRFNTWSHDVRFVSSYDIQFNQDFENLLKLRSTFNLIRHLTSSSVAYTFLYTHTFWKNGRYSFIFGNKFDSNISEDSLTPNTKIDTIRIHNNEKDKDIATISFETGTHPGWYISIPSYGKFHLCGRPKSKHMINVLDYLCNESSKLINRIDE